MVFLLSTQMDSYNTPTKPPPAHWIEADRYRKYPTLENGPRPRSCYQRNQADEDSSKQAVISREIQINYPEKRIVRMYMVPIDAPSTSDTTGGYVVVLSDITEAQINLVKLSNMKSDSVMGLAAGVAHELGNPLNSLTIHLQLIRRKLKDAIKEKNQKPLLNP